MTELTKEALERQQEILADIAFEAGNRWARTDSTLCGKVIDALNGSRGLIEEFIDWANEFDLLWEAGELDPEDYIGELCRFADRKLTELFRDHA
ncbi:hypothetical protein [Burkholderia sp. Bp9004]|uniref:hypothetical protein n=1 Tax=Burkholderia sp. Bp9004 TaxID=2184559 RepID=UPI000F5F3EC0|nr:hypothetical protein [Burkholderia sp. Bp9004]RQZ70139.1 hypothetical protein DIE08_05995 [Burkholderia sp. Bp9004]